MEQNIIVHGVDDSIEINDAKEKEPFYKPNERCKAAALDFFKKEMKLDLTMEDIWKVHRSGAFKPNKVRPMVIRLSYAAKGL